MLRIDLVSTPQGLKLQRIIQTESYRFPEIFTDSYDIGSFPTIKFLAKVLRRENEAGTIAIDDTIAAANAFVSMVVTGPVKYILAAMPLPPEELAERIAFGVNLFLNGARPR